jgi:hypothetical protein
LLPPPRLPLPPVITKVSSCCGVLISPRAAFFTARLL